MGVLDSWVVWLAFCCSSAGGGSGFGLSCPRRGDFGGRLVWDAASLFSLPGLA